MIETQLLHPNNLIVITFVWIIVGAFRRAIPQVMDHPLAVRFLPVFPMLLCSIAVWLPGVAPHIHGVANRIMMGIVLGALAANGHKIFRQTALGQDERIKKPPLGTL